MNLNLEQNKSSGSENEGSDMGDLDMDDGI